MPVPAVAGSPRWRTSAPPGPSTSETASARRSSRSARPAVPCPPLHQGPSAPTSSATARRAGRASSPRLLAPTGVGAAEPRYRAVTTMQASCDERATCSRRSILPCASRMQRVPRPRPGVTTQPRACWTLYEPSGTATFRSCPAQVVRAQRAAVAARHIGPVAAERDVLRRLVGAQLAEHLPRSGVVIALASRSPEVTQTRAGSGVQPTSCARTAAAACPAAAAGPGSRRRRSQFAWPSSRVRTQSVRPPGSIVDVAGERADLRPRHDATPRDVQRHDFAALRVTHERMPSVGVRRRIARLSEAVRTCVIRSVRASTMLIAPSSEWATTARLPTVSMLRGLAGEGM